MKYLFSILAFLIVQIGFSQTLVVLDSGKPVIAETYDLLIDSTLSITQDETKSNIKEGAKSVSKKEYDQIMRLWEYYEKLVKQNRGIRRGEQKEALQLIKATIKKIKSEK